MCLKKNSIRKVLIGCSSTSSSTGHNNTLRTREVFYEKKHSCFFRTGLHTYLSS